jgi:MFS family permease
MFNLFKPKNPNKWIGLVLASLALAIVIIDGTVLNVSQSNIISSIGLSSAQNKILEGFKGIQWATTLYSLVVAALTIWGGRLADKYGKKRIFLTGAVLFAVGSLVTAMSYYWGVSTPEGLKSVFGSDFYGMYWLLIGWSVIEGIGAAMMLPATIALIVSNFEGKERGVAFGVWGATAGFSAAIGPLLGGYFTTYANWSWAFLINVFVVAVLILFSGNIADISKKQPEIKIEYLSVALSALGLSAITYGLIEASTYGWWAAKEAWQTPFGQTIDLAGGLSITPYALAFGLFLLVLFVARQFNLRLHKKNPLIDLDLFRHRQYSVGLISLIFFSIGFSSLLFALPFFLQVILGLDAFNSGLAFIPFSLASLVAAPVGGILANKVSAKLLVVVGITLNAIGLAWIGTAITLEWTQWSFVLPFIVMGIGGGLAQAQLGNLTLSDIEGRQSGEASGVQSAVRQLGQTLSTALIGSVFVSVLASSVMTNINSLPDIQLPRQGKDNIIKTFSDTQPLYGISPQAQKKAAEENKGRLIPEYVVKQLKQSAVDSSKAALQVGAISSLIAAVVALFFKDLKKLAAEAGKKSTTPVGGH